MKRLLFEIGLNDKFSANMRKIAGKAGNAIDKINKSLLKTKPLSKNIDQLEHKLRDLEKKRKLSFDIKNIKKISREIDGVERQIARIERKGRMTGKNGSRMSGGGSGMISKAGLVGAGLGLAYGGIRLGAEIIQTTASYEKYRAVLKNTYQDQTKANMAMADLENFASKTPFQINELTDSFIKLENSGFKPTMADMTNLGDLASSQGKTFGQLGEAVLDAQMGEFERLKEFGIKGSTGKNSYKFTFKGETSEIEKSSKAVKEYILSLGKLKGVQGGMNAISKTTGGKLSNLGDNWDQLKATIGDANSGVIKGAISGFSALVGKVNDYMKVPLSQKMREEQYGLKSLIGVITDSNTSNEDRLRLLTQLKEEYPDFLGNIDAETASNEDLLKRLDAVNASYEKRISLQSAIEQKKYQENIVEEATTERDVAQRTLKLLEDARDGDKAALDQVENQMTNGENFEIWLSNLGQQQGARSREEKLQSYLQDKINEQQTIIVKTNKILKKNKVKVSYNELITYLDSKNPNLDKLSGKDKERYDDWMGQLKDKSNILKGLMQKKGFNSDNINYKEKIKEISTLKSLIGGLFEEEDPNKPKKRTFSPSSSKSNLNSGVDSIAGESKVAKNLTINISELISGNIEIISQTLNEGTAEMKQKVLEALLSAVNDVNGA